MRDFLEDMAGYTILKAYCTDGTDKTAALADKLSRSIKFRDLKTLKGVLYVRISMRDEEYTRRLAGDMGMTCEVTERHGIGNVIRNLRHRTGIFIGAAIAAVMVFFLSNTVLRIEISGNTDVCRDEILSYLKDAGLYYGSFIPFADLRSAQRQLSASSEKLAWASIRSSGFRLIVEVAESTEPPRVILKNDPCNVVSLYDAQITSVSVHSGMLMPMMGDTVRKGEILISGIVSRKFEGTYQVHAMGEIRGIYRRTAEFSQSYEDTVRVNGEEFTNSYLSISGRSFSLPGNKRISEPYEFTRERKPIEFLCFTLPADMVYLNITPYEEVSVTYTREQAAQILLTRMDSFEKELLTDETTEIKDRTYDFSESDGMLTLKAEYLVEGNIGTEKPIY